LIEGYLLPLSIVTFTMSVAGKTFIIFMTADFEVFLGAPILGSYNLSSLNCGLNHFIMAYTSKLTNNSTACSQWVV
jgi:hypothetical protein